MLYVLSHPIQYLSPLLKALSQKTKLKVLYCSESGLKSSFDKGFSVRFSWDTPLLDGYDYTFIKNFREGQFMQNKFWDIFNPGIISTIWRSHEKIIIVNGWSYSTNWLVFITGKLAGKEIWLRAENPLNQEIRKRPIIIFLKKIILRHILFRLLVNKFLFIGSQNRQFYEFYGVSDSSKFIFTPYSVNNDFFREKHKELFPIRENLRNLIGISKDTFVFLFSGKYIHKKRPLDLLKAYHKLNLINTALVFTGEGELRAEMEEYINKHNLINVFLTGFINQSKIPEYYTIADSFVMCSGMGETWGLSVNEAMNFGLPIVVSRTCGSAHDLVEDGVNGYLFEEGDIDGLSNILNKLAVDADKSKQMGKRSIEIVDNYSIPVIVRNICKNL